MDQDATQASSDIRGGIAHAVLYSSTDIGVAASTNQYIDLIHPMVYLTLC